MGGVCERSSRAADRIERELDGNERAQKRRQLQDGPEGPEPPHPDCGDD